MPVVITVYSDRSFTFITKTPPASVLLKKAAGISKGSATPNTDKVGKVTRAQLEEIAKTKDARSDCGGYGCGSAHHRRQCSQHGPGSGGCVTWRN